MGCDGGTIPKRVEMIKLKKKKEKVKKEEALMAKWRHCTISSQSLNGPIVACCRGNLYNKESVIEGLLDAAKMPELAQHIKSLKDVTVLNLSKNPSFKEDKKNGDSFEDAQSSEFICPVTGLEMTGVYRFVFLRTCGCVFSERALKEVPSETCHKCGKPFSASDVYVINGEEEDVRRQEAAAEEAKKQSKVAKKKRRAAESKVAPGDDEESSIPSEKKTKPVSQNEELLGNRQPNSAAAQVGPKLNGSHSVEPDKKPLKVATGSTVKGSAKRIVDSVTRSLQDHKVVADDPSARKVFKSIFNSSQSSDKQAHWVTFNAYK
jgi:hypothetical protein